MKIQTDKNGIVASPGVDESLGGPVEGSEPNDGRRALLKAMATASGVVASRILLPALWSSPVVATLLLPEHASASSPACYQTGAPAGNATWQFDGLSTISGANSDGTTTLTITLTNDPNLVPPTQVTVYELKPNATSSNVAGSIVVTAATIGNPLKLSLPRASGSGTYQYALSWSGYCTSWVSVST